MSASIRPDPAGGKLWLQIDGVDVLELTPSALKVDGDELAKLTGATFTGDISIAKAGALLQIGAGQGGPNGIELGDDGGDPAFLYRRTGGDAVRFENAAGEPLFSLNVNAPATGAAIGNGSGGTNPIAERGSNSNGEYVRFYDGTQICWGVQAVTLSGGAVAEALSPVDFPAAFSSPPSGRGTISQLQGESGGREHVAYHYQGYPRTTSIRFGVVPAAGNANTNANDLEIDWEAIGRWK